jgi:hypothetical protein
MRWRVIATGILAQLVRWAQITGAAQTCARASHYRKIA